MDYLKIMDFNKAITLSGKLYKFLEKFKLENLISLDSLIDSHFPQALSRLQTYAKDSKIAIVSTNGKKTTANLINQILLSNKKTFISNVSKDAKRYPVLTSVILDVADENLFSDELQKKDYYVMAMDENEAIGYFSAIKFDYLLLGNIFFDQKDFLTTEEKRRKIQDIISLNSGCSLIINADDPMYYNIDEIKHEIGNVKKLNKIYYGFNNIETSDENLIIQENDLTRCPKCGCKLDYVKRYYSHIGHYECECGFRRPKLDIWADAKVFNNYSFLSVYFKDNKYVFKLPFGGVYNAYNALGAIALAVALGIERKVITNAFENYTSIKARDEILNYRNKKIKFKIIKNPESFSEATRELLFQKKTKLIFCLNDTVEDGKDTGWIWSANLDSLADFENKIYVSGTRCDDMALRLKYAGVNPNLMVIDNSLNNCVNCCFYDLEDDENMMILSCPSGEDEIKEILEKQH